MFILRPQTSHHHYACMCRRRQDAIPMLPARWSSVAGWVGKKRRISRAPWQPGEDTAAVGFPSTGL